MDPSIPRPSLYNPQSHPSSAKIGKNFEEFFADTIEINMLDSDSYLRIKQKIIDVLDQATHVYVKGKGKNKTDLHVQLQPLADPLTQTNFFNRGATVNIPWGGSIHITLVEGHHMSFTRS